MRPYSFNLLWPCDHGNCLHPALASWATQNVEIKTKSSVQGIYEVDGHHVGSRVVGRGCDTAIRANCSDDFFDLFGFFRRLFRRLTSHTDLLDLADAQSTSATGGDADKGISEEGSRTVCPSCAGRRMAASAGSFSALRTSPRAVTLQG